MNDRDVTKCLENFMKENNIRGSCPSTYQIVSEKSQSDLWNFICNLVDVYSSKDSNEKSNTSEYKKTNNTINCKSIYCKFNKNDNCILKNIHLDSDNECLNYNYDVNKSRKLKKECMDCIYHKWIDFGEGIAPREKCILRNEWVASRTTKENEKCWE